MVDEIVAMSPQELSHFMSKLCMTRKTHVIRSIANRFEKEKKKRNVSMAPAERSAQKDEGLSRQKSHQDMTMLRIRIPYQEMNIICQPYTCPILFLDGKFVHVPNEIPELADMMPAQISLGNLRGEVIYNAFIHWPSNNISLPQMWNMSLQRVMQDFSVSPGALVPG